MNILTRPDREQQPGAAAAEVRHGPPLPSRPGATLRLQLHRDFTFDDARAHIGYFAELGITHIYASPILTARAGSTHGYDVVDHSRVNPELGGEEGLRAFVTELRRHGMGLIVDIVPNHMAVGGADNRWWLDVLEWGRESRHARSFDIDWDSNDPMLSNRLLAPFLGKPYGEALKNGEIAVHFDAVNGRFHAAYFEHRFPIAPQHYPLLLRSCSSLLAGVVTQFLVSLAHKAGSSARYAGFAQACRSLTLAARDAPVANAIVEVLEHYSPHTSEGQQRLHELLERQHYRLAWWRTAPDIINWRRFFDIADLAGLRVEEPAVFEAVHEKIFDLYGAGLIDGLRIDHIDGLANPRAYCRLLRSRLRRLESQRPTTAPRGPAYIVVEKILGPDECLSLDWQVDGTSGYKFMSDVGALLHDAAGEEPLRAFWGESSGRADNFEAEERAARRRILQDLLLADFHACAHTLCAIARRDRATRDWTPAAIRRVLTEMLVHFPVYRTYADSNGRSEADAAVMARVVAAARPACRPAERELLDTLDRWLGGEPPALAGSAALRHARLRALGRFQQLTSPLAAKAVEDTAFYRYGTLLSRNEVGATPPQFAMSIEEFHRACAERRARYPYAMLATATHDHKRGEDLRARLAVLSEMPDRWATTVGAWYQLNAGLKPKAGGAAAPDPADEYMLYQMLAGGWPLQLAADDNDGVVALRDRLTLWQEKAIREAKRRSGWLDPELDYEAACQTFLRRLLDVSSSRTFLSQLEALVREIAAAGALNGLIQALLRMTTPGVPDLYQGCEFWDFSFVDPDNRRPVDFAEHASGLQQPIADADLFGHWRDGRVKQQLIRRVLDLRRRSGKLFSDGSYVPLPAQGHDRHRVLAFARQHGRLAAIVAVPLHCSSAIEHSAGLKLKPGALGEVQLPVPDHLRNRRWIDALSGDVVGSLPVAIGMPALFRRWPLACWYCDDAGD